MFELLFFYWIILDQLKISENDKINHNLIKLNHTLLSLIISSYVSYYNHNHYSTFINLFFYNFSKTYFIWDTIKLINTNSITLPIAIHHFGTVYLLYEFTNTLNPCLLNLFFIGELSNISIYFTYHMIKIKSHYIQLAELFQIFWYGYCRVYLLSTNLQYIHTVQNNILLLFLFIIYFAGIGWWHTLLKNYLYEYHKSSYFNYKFDLVLNE